MTAMQPIGCAPVAALGGGFEGARQAWIDLLNGTLSGVGTFDGEKEHIAVTDVARTSDTVVTITIDGLDGNLDLSANDEVFADTIPGWLTQEGADVLTTGSFTIVDVAAAPDVETGIEFDGTQRVYKTDLTWSATAVDLTLSFWFKRDATPAASEYIFRHYASHVSEDSSTVAYLNTSGHMFVEVKGTNTNAYFNHTFNNVCDGVWHHVMVTWDAGGNSWVAIDGARTSKTNANASTYQLQGTDGPTDDGIFVGALNSTGTSPYAGCVADVWFENVAYSNSDASVQKFRNTNGTPADLGATGNLPGQQPHYYRSNGAVHAATNFGDGDDPYTVVGTLTDCAFFLHYTTTPGVDNLALTGKAPTVSLTGDIVAQPGADNLALTGKAPAATLVTRFTTAPGVDTLALTGKTPTTDLAERSTVAPGADSLALTGKAPVATLIERFTVAPGAGALALTGKVPEVTKTSGLTVLPGPDYLALTGKEPTAQLVAIYTAEPGVDNLVLTGKAPTASVVVRINVAPGPDLLALTGKAPSVVGSSSFTAQPGADTLVLTGKAPTATLQLGAQPGADLLALTGKAPTTQLVLRFQVSPGVDQLALSGKTPRLVLTGAVPSVPSTLVLVTVPHKLEEVTVPHSLVDLTVSSSATKLN